MSEQDDACENEEKHAGRSLREVQEHEEERLKRQMDDLEAKADHQHAKAEVLENDFNGHWRNKELNEARYEEHRLREEAHKLRDQMDEMHKPHAGLNVGRKLED